MPKQTVTVSNLGQIGYVPDVTPTALPPNAITYARNFRFTEGNFAEVTTGYSNALSSRTKETLGDSDTQATFLWTWLLNDDNAFVYYDAASAGLFYVEQNDDSNLVEFRLSYEKTFQKALSYSMLSEATDTEFAYSAGDTDTLTILDTDEQGLDVAGIANADVIIYEPTIKTELAKSRVISVTTTDSEVEMKLENSLITDFDSDVAYTKDTLVRFSSVIYRNASDVDSDGDNPDVDGSGWTEVGNLQFFIGTPFEHSGNSSGEPDYRWSATDALGIPIFNNTTEAPWEFVDDFHPYVKRLTNWPTDGGENSNVARCEALTAFGQSLAAIGYRNEGESSGLYEGGTRTLAISDAADAGALPSWDFSAEDGATYFDLSLFSDGALVSGFEFNNQLFVNTTTTVIAVTGDAAVGYSGTKLPIGAGCLTRRTSVAIPNGAFTLGNGIAYTHDGNSFREVGNGRWSESWFNRVDEERIDEVQVVYSPRSHEIWIKTPISSDSQEIWIYNLNTDTMSVLDDHNEVKYMTWSADGIPAVDTTWNTFPSETEWDDINVDAWNEFAVLVKGDYRNRILSVGYGDDTDAPSEMFVHDFGFTYNTREIDAILQREYAQVNPNTYESGSIERVIPWIEAGNTGDVISIRVGGADNPSKDTVWTPYKSYTYGTTEKLDFRRRAKWAGVSFKSTDSGTKISGFDLEIVPQNRR